LGLNAKNLGSNGTGTTGGTRYVRCTPRPPSSLCPASVSASVSNVAGLASPPLSEFTKITKGKMEMKRKIKGVMLV
jgi:hypothetical protein